MTFEVGNDGRPVIASIHFYAPGDCKGVPLQNDFEVKPSIPNAEYCG